MNINEKIGISPAPWVIDNIVDDTCKLKTIDYMFSFTENKPVIQVDNENIAIYENDLNAIKATPNMVDAIYHCLKENEKPCGKDCNAPNGCDCWVNRSMFSLKMASDEKWEEVKKCLDQSPIQGERE